MEKEQEEFLVAGVVINKDGEFIYKFVNPDLVKLAAGTVKDEDFFETFWEITLESLNELEEEIKKSMEEHKGM